MLRPLLALTFALVLPAMDLPTVPDQARLDAALERALRWLPPATAPVEARVDGLWRVAAAAADARRFGIASAAGSRLTERWPFHGLPWGNLACHYGFQGRWAEAAQATATAAACAWHQETQVAGIAPTWRWHLGDRAGATAAMQAFSDDGSAMAAACLVLYHAGAGSPPEGWRHAVERLAAPGQERWWRRWVQTTPVLDAHRGAAWFQAIAGAPSGPRHGRWGEADPTPVPASLAPAPMPEPERRARAALPQALAALGQGDWAAAVAAASAARSAAPLPETVMALALAHAARGERRQAMGALRELGGLDTPLGSWAVDAAPLMDLGPAVIRRLRGERRTRAVALAITVHAHWSLAWGNDAEARQLYDAALSWDRALPEAWNGRGLTWIGHDDRRATEDFRTAISLWPEYPDARGNLALVLGMAGQAEEAAAILAAIPAAAPATPGRIAAQAVARIAAGDPDGAIALIDAALAGPVGAHIRPGLLWEVASQASWQGHPAASAALCERIIAIAPWMTDAWLKQAGELERLGDPAGAEALVRRALAEGEPESMDGWLILAALRARAGDRDHARAIAARIPVPADPRAARQWHALMAFLADAEDDEAAVRAHLEASLDPDEGERTRQWIAAESLLARWRGRPWFAALVAAPDADPERH
ncbi:MAG: Tetratricopeptide repeat [Planctomycetota bacterium]|jgi:tetratricopeptide (TPR) repeat protein